MQILNCIVLSSAVHLFNWHNSTTRTFSAVLILQNTPYSAKHFRIFTKYIFSKFRILHSVNKYTFTHWGQQHNNQFISLISKTGSRPPGSRDYIYKNPGIKNSILGSRNANYAIIGVKERFLAGSALFCVCVIAFNILWCNWLLVGLPLQGNLLPGYPAG